MVQLNKAIDVMFVNWVIRKLVNWSLVNGQWTLGEWGFGNWSLRNSGKLLIKKQVKSILAVIARNKAFIPSHWFKSCDAAICLFKLRCKEQTDCHVAKFHCVHFVSRNDGNRQTLVTRHSEGVDEPLGE